MDLQNWGAYCSLNTSMFISSVLDYIVVDILKWRYYRRKLDRHAERPVCSENLVVDMATILKSREILSSLLHLFGSVDLCDHGFCE